MWWLTQSMRGAEKDAGRLDRVFFLLLLFLSSCWHSYDERFIQWWPLIGVSCYLVSGSLSIQPSGYNRTIIFPSVIHLGFKIESDVLILKPWANCWEQIYIQVYSYIHFVILVIFSVVKMMGMFPNTCIWFPWIANLVNSQHDGNERVVYFLRTEISWFPWNFRC